MGVSDVYVNRIRSSAVAAGVTGLRVLTVIWFKSSYFYGKCMVFWCGRAVWVFGGLGVVCWFGIVRGWFVFVLFFW